MVYLSEIFMPFRFNENLDNVLCIIICIWNYVV